VVGLPRDSGPAATRASSPPCIGPRECEFLDSIYQAPLAPDGYGDVVRMLRRATGAAEAGIWARDDASPDPLVAEGLDVATVAELQTENRVWAADWIVAVRSGQLRSALVSGPGRAPWRDRDRALLERLAPHLLRSLRLHLRIATLEAERHGLVCVLDRVAAAVVVVDTRGRVVDRNEAARRLLAAGDGLAVRDGRLVAARAGDTRRMARAIAGGGDQVRPIMVHRPSGVARLSVLVVPASSSVDNSRVVVFINDPERVPLPHPSTLRELYALTPAESRLSLALARGLSLQQVAATFGIAEHTARNHLKAVFAKTGERRQAALVRRLLAAACPVDRNANSIRSATSQTGCAQP